MSISLPIGAPGSSPRLPLVNLSHLDSLVEPASVDGHDVGLLHIYSDAPRYGWNDAAGEGIACLDDSARAAVVYLHHYEETHDAHSLEQAHRMLEFVGHMQSSDGEYYNFVTDRQGTINRDGITSRKSFGWWAARGQWALAEGYRILRSDDPTFAETLRQRYLLGQSALERHLPAPGAGSTLHGTSLPGGLLDDAADLSALVLLGLCEYQAAQPNDVTRRLIEQLGNGLASYRVGDARTSPFGVHPDTTTSLSRWHAWGSHQVQALCVAGRLLSRPDWVQSAQGEVDDFVVPMLVSDLAADMQTIPSTHQQIAYGDSMLSSGLLALADATGNPQYARLGGLAASWLTGNNRAGQPMYDAATGRGYDGLDDNRINVNSGAESTIEALWTLLAVEHNPDAAAWLGARAEHPIASAWQVLEAESGQVTGPSTAVAGGTEEADFSGGRAVRLESGSKLRLDADGVTGTYDVFLSHLHDGTCSIDVDGQVLHPRPAEPDAKWLSLDRLSDEPIQLGSGPHVITVTADTPVTIDAVALRATTLSNTFLLSDGRRETVAWQAGTAHYDISEK